VQCVEEDLDHSQEERRIVVVEERFAQSASGECAHLVGPLVEDNPSRVRAAFDRVAEVVLC